MDLNLRSTTASRMTLDSLSSLSEHLGFALCSRDIQRTAFVGLLQRINLDQHTVGTPFPCPDCLYFTYTPPAGYWVLLSSNTQDGIKLQMLLQYFLKARSRKGREGWGCEWIDGTPSHLFQGLPGSPA